MLVRCNNKAKPMTDDISRPDPEPYAQCCTSKTRISISCWSSAAGGHLARVSLIRAATGSDGVARVRADHPDLVLLACTCPTWRPGSGACPHAGNFRRAEGGAADGDHLSMDILKPEPRAYEYWVKPISASQLEKGVRRGLAAAAQDPWQAPSSTRPATTEVAPALNATFRTPASAPAQRSSEASSRVTLSMRRGRTSFSKKSCDRLKDGPPQLIAIGGRPPPG